MVTNVLIFLLMTFWIWGWVLAWPLSKIRSDAVKGTLWWVFVAMIATSAIVDISVGLDPSPLKISAVFSEKYLLWISFAITLLGTTVVAFHERPDGTSASQYFGFAFVISLVCTLVMWGVCWVISRILTMWLIPVFQSLFVAV